MPFWANYIIIALIVSFGIIAGFFAAMWSKLGVFIIGCWVGATTGNMTFNAIFSGAVGGNGKDFYLLFMCGFIIMGGIIGSILYTHFIAFGSAIAGSYALVRVLFLN